MADGEVVTTRLEVDITNMKKGMSDASRYVRMADSEFAKATASMGKWSDNADGLRAKLTQLNKTLEGQEAAAAVLRHEYERVVAEQGETSKGAQELAIRLNKQEAACKKTASQIDHYKGKLEDMENNTEEAVEATGSLSTAMGKAASAAGKLVGSMAKLAGKSIVTGIKAIATASAGLVTAFLATGEAQKDYITEMAKLDAAYKSSGHSAETAGKTYQELYGIIGETDQAVEAAQQIALLANSEKEAARWAEQAAGVVATFGDALQPEAFFEAANETFSLNEATGAYTQMIEQCGLSVDDFNAGLQACTTAEEKQAYMLAYTEAALGSAGAEYRNNAAAIIENNKATAEMNNVMAQVGESSMPVMTALKLMGASILTDLLPNIKQLGTAFPEALNGSKTAAAEMGTAVSGMLQQLIQKFAAALPSIITVGASIIGSLVQGLIDAGPALAAGVGQIAQYFIGAAPQLLSAAGSMVQSIVGGFQSRLPQILETGGQVVYQLLSGIGSSLPQVAQMAVTAISGFASGLQTYLPVVLEKGREILTNLGTGIKENLPSLVSQALDAIMTFATTLYDNAPHLIETGFDLLSNLVQGILDCIPTLLSKAPEIVSKFANIINDNFPTILKKGVELVWQIIKGLISAIPTLIKNIPKIITAIVDVWEAFNWLNLGKKAITWLKDGVLKMVSAVKSAGKTIMSSITDIIKQLPGKLLEFGKNAITKLASGITSMLSSAKNAGTSVFNGIVNIIKNLPSKLLEFGRDAISKLGSSISSGVSNVKTAAGKIFDTVVNSIKELPSKMLSIGKDLVTGLWNGISDMTGWIIGKIEGFGDSVLGGIKKFFGIGSPSKVMAAEVGKWLPAGMAEGITSNTKAATKAMTNMARSALGAANSALSGGITVPVSGGAAAAGGGRAAGATYVFNQYNNSPKALSRADIYRQTKNQLRFATANA